MKNGYFIRMTRVRRARAHIAVATTVWLALFAFGAPSPATAQESDTCLLALNDTCDAPGGTGLCLAGTDFTDCGGVSTDVCPFVEDGECDEPGGTGLCPAGTDTADCGGLGRDLERAFFGQDDREIVDATAAPWRMIGRLELQSGGHCSGTMVGPRLVLTAAHCVFLEDGARDPAVSFTAGADDGAGVARAGVVRDWVAPGFDIVRHSETTEIDGLDWAFVELDADIGAVTGTMDVRQVTTEELRAAIDGAWTISQAGYSGDNETRLTAHIDCAVMRVFDDDTIFHQCDTLQGDSGSPLFIEENGRHQIIALESSVYENDDAEFADNMAVDARAFYGMWRSLVSGKVR